MDYSTPAGQEALDAAKKALEANGFNVIIAENGEDAKAKILALVPEKAEVFNMTSITLDTIGISAEINESGKYEAVRAKMADPAVSAREKKRLGSAPEWALGSVHAVTLTGELMIASNTGSQLGAYSYGADHVVFVAGTQKIVKDKQEGTKRIYDYVLPKETIRARAAYNQPDTFHSFVSKVLIINREVAKDRITVILVKESVGF